MVFQHRHVTQSDSSKVLRQRPLNKNISFEMPALGMGWAASNSPMKHLLWIMTEYIKINYDIFLLVVLVALEIIWGVFIDGKI